MKRLIPVLWLLCVSSAIVAQTTVTAKLSAALRTLERDPQLKAAITSLYVVDATTGRTVFSRNEGIGLAPASTQKIITAATAYALLGRDFRYQTELRYAGTPKDSLLNGTIYIVGDGDPTLGSRRWRETRDTAIISQWTTALKRKGIAGLDSIHGRIVIDESKFEAQAIPDGWIWQDLGNYYGAASRGLNWKENQFDIILRSGSKVGDPVVVVQSGLTPLYANGQGTVQNELRSAGKGTGDNAYIYMPFFSDRLLLTGTIPVDERNFSISGSIPDPPRFLANQLRSRWQRSRPLTADTKGSQPGLNASPGNPTTLVTTHSSPVLDSVIFWFQRRSINLYGEALVKAISKKSTGYGATDTGIHLLQEFWKKQGVEKEALNIVDGSGLSPLNRVTTQAQVAVLRYARQQPWFEGYFHSFPEFNGMKMKSGTIRGVKAFAGYHTSKAGNTYLFSFIINNYNGSSAALIKKMYAVLDALK